MKKIEQEKNRPASNIPYQGVNKPFRTLFVMPGQGVEIEQDANGVCYIHAAAGSTLADLVAGDNIEITKTDDGKTVISAVDTATDIAAGQNITIDIDPETGTAVINSITGGATNEHYKGVFDTAEDLIAFDTDPETGDYGMIKHITYSDGGETSWNGQYKYCFYINGQWTVVDQMLTFTDDIDLLQQFYSVGGSSPVIYLHKIAQTGSFRDLRDVPIVATPKLTVDGKTLTATCDTEGAEIWYTTDGTMPHVNGNKYTSPITVNDATMFRFVGIKNGMINSLEATVSMEYDLQPPTIDLDWHDGTVTMANPNQSGTIYYTTDGTTPTNASNVYTDPFVITESTNFRLIVIDGANQSSITNKAYQRVPTAGIGGGLNSANGFSTITLTSESGSEIHYTIDGSTPTYQSELYSAAFKVHYYDYVLVSTRVFKEGYVPSVVHASRIGKSKPVDPPYSFDPETNTVTLADSQNYNSSGNAVSGNIAGVPGYVTYNPVNIQPLLYHRIWYTLDGSTPSPSNGTMYNGPIHIDGHSVTLKAVLVGYGQYYSDVITENIEIISEPTISLDSDTGFVSIEGPEGSTIYYTIDGSTPTTESSEYSAPFDVTNMESVTVKALCVLDGFQSAVAEVTYPGLLRKWSGTSGGGTDYSVGTISRTPRRAVDGASVFYAVRDGGGYPSLADWIPYTGTEIRIPLFDENNPKEFFFRQTKPGYIPGYYGGTRVGYIQPDAPTIEYDASTGIGTLSLSGNTSQIPLQTNENVPQIGARIYYTLDGSEPGPNNGILYDGNPLSLGVADPEIKAVTVCYGRYFSEVSERDLSYLHFTAGNEGATFVFYSDDNRTVTLYLSRESSHGVWIGFNTSPASSADQDRITLNPGETVYLRGLESTLSDNTGYIKCRMTGEISACGPLTALIGGSNVVPEYCFKGLFEGCTSLKKAPDLKASEFGDHSCRSLFSGCTSLTSAARVCGYDSYSFGEFAFYTMYFGCSSLVHANAIEADQMANGSFGFMFGNCTSLVHAPELRVEELTHACFANLFHGCTNLVSVPDLPWEVAASGCFAGMFYDCTSLEHAPTIGAKTLNTISCQNMFYGCTSLLEGAVMDQVETLDRRSCEGMYGGCTSLVSAPVLTAEVLGESSYKEMFKGCSSLSSIHTKMNDISATDCLLDWVDGVSATGDFYCPDELVIDSGVSGVPTGWNRHDYYDIGYLFFYMPNGGTVSLNKTGSPTVVELEYSIDQGETWTVWPEDESGNRSLTLTAGQRMHVRNTSETSTGFSTVYGTDFYNFDFSNVTYANGNTNSLLCKNPQNAVITNSCFTYLYRNCGNLKSASSFPSTTLASTCYRALFVYTGIEKSPLLPASIIPGSAYQSIFYASPNLSEIKTYMTNISASHSLDFWCGGGISSTGDFYCPAELTIPTGTSGIPSGWTRHDI